ncbi:hypothetical protein EJP67_28955 [Variovorax guangxiensis]|uniref:Uncharacterized protein n=1 Tax=Variovorax guangxiensis TaxID=1775474 RepID=A0A433MT81_9BURK|nr:hypothetical protein [Variovorax guangxiensis]RUR71091.1 hypothetical protein EJP67_28955 [Variovorax guangxiensis]
MYEFIAWSKLNPSEQAAWVQAVGSVVAILIAIAVPALAARSRFRTESAARKERMLNAALRVFDPISSLRESMAEFLETLSDDFDPENRGVRTDPNNGDYEPLIQPVIASVAVLDDLGTMAPAMRKFLFELIELDRFMKAIPAIQSSGVPAFWRTNLPDIRDRIREVVGSADFVIAEMRKVMMSPASQ